MKNLISISFILYSFAVFAQFDTVFLNFPESKALYIDKNLPGEEPQEFLSNFIDFEKHHIHSAPKFTPDMQEMYFSMYVNNDFPQRIFYTKKENGNWTNPQLVSFSGTYQEGGPVISPDGNSIYYYSKRPISGTEPRKKLIIWFVERQEDNTWCEPNYIHLNYKDSNIYLPISHTNSNHLIYLSGTNGQHPMDVYKGKIKGNKLTKIKKLNTPYQSQQIKASVIHISNDNNKIFFWKVDRNSTPRSITYISKFTNKEWTEPKITKASFNKGGSRFPSFTPDGKYVFFLSYRSGVERWYWIDAKSIK